MKPSTELFELIKSLNKSEKRFFKLSSALQSGDKNYLRIFDAIDRQKEYDEESLKNQFQDETFVKHLPSEKNHLYKLILKSLRAFHAEDSISSILKQEIKNIEILYKKALYKECTKFLLRAKKMAVMHEKFYYWFELLNWEKLLLEEAYEAGEFTTDLDALIREEQEVIEKLRNLAAYHVLYSKINYVFRSGGVVRNKEDDALVSEISEHPLIVGKNTALSQRAATICYYIQGFCAMARSDRRLALEKFNKVKSILDNNTLIRQDLTKRYVRVLSSIVNLRIELGEAAEARKMIKELRSLQEVRDFQADNVDILLYRTIALAEMKLLQRLGKFEEACKLGDQTILQIEQFGEKIHKEPLLLLYYNLSLVNFGSGQYNKALFWINKVLNDNENNLRQDIYSYARLFNLVIHYELGNFDLLDYIIKSAQRYLNKRKRNYELELLILGYMKKLTKSSRAHREEEVLREFLDALEARMNANTDTAIFEFFNYPLWIKSKLNGTPISQIIHQTLSGSSTAVSERMSA